MQNYRNGDPTTSMMAGESVKDRLTNFRLRLLEQYEKNRTEGLTDDEARSRAGFTRDHGYWKRCSDLRNAGYVAPTGQTRPGNSGRQQMVCVITDEGRDFFYEWT